MQAIWKLFLDGDVKEAYKSGIVIELHDGVRRRLFIRIFLYIADYPEK